MIGIVSGLPRAGTSMMMQIVGAGGVPLLTDELRVPDASNPRGYWEYEPVKRMAQDVSWLPEAEGKVVKIVAPLLRYLPPGPAYRVLMMERDLEEVLRSQAAMLQRLGRPTGNPEVLKTAFQQQQAQALAHLARLPDTQVLTVSYRAVVAAPQAEGARIAAFVRAAGWAFDAEAAMGAVAPSLYREQSAAPSRQTR